MTRLFECKQAGYYLYASIVKLSVLIRLYEANLRKILGFG